MFDVAAMNLMDGDRVGVLAIEQGKHAGLRARFRSAPLFLERRAALASPPVGRWARAGAARQLVSAGWALAAVNERR